MIFGHRLRLLACTVAFLVACSGADEETVKSTSTAMPATQTTAKAPAGTPTTQASETTAGQPDSEDEKAVLDAYQGYWRAILQANDPPDQSNPVLRQYATGDAYMSVFEAAQFNRLSGRALRLPPNAQYEHRASVVSLSETAVVRDCSIDDAQVVDLSTGAIIDGSVVTRLSTATLVQEDGTWKVANSRVEQTWNGVAGCATER